MDLIKVQMSQIYLNFSWSDITTTDIRPSACFVHSSCSSFTCKQERLKSNSDSLSPEHCSNSLGGLPSPQEFPTDGQKQIWIEVNFDKSSEQVIYRSKKELRREGFICKNYWHPNWGARVQLGQIFLVCMQVGGHRRQ